jgi:hypothetical protein
VRLDEIERIVIDSRPNAHRLRINRAGCHAVALQRYEVPRSPDRRRGQGEGICVCPSTSCDGAREVETRAVKYIQATSGGREAMYNRRILRVSPVGSKRALSGYPTLATAQLFFSQSPLLTKPFGTLNL